MKRSQPPLLPSLLSPFANAVSPAHALGAQTIYRQISTDVTCSGDRCLTLIEWHGLAAKWCNRFQ
jgi:hypothetical protein